MLSSSDSFSLDVLEPGATSELGVASSKLGPGDVFSAIFVKMDRRVLEKRNHKRVDAGEQEDGGRIITMDEGVIDRNGVSTSDLLLDSEAALERAYRYWPIAEKRVKQWIKEPETCPKYLIGLTKDGSWSWVRYVWKIDPEGAWESYPAKTKKWGVPILQPAEPLRNHPFLRRVPLGNDGRQILASRQSGFLAGVFRIVQLLAPRDYSL